ncbi:HalOD1 output domain-containing protein [Halopiger goleimassiliensis]|uniref:HalOD1 output domain-containing protein n=1 Tax=Halopiger goleimassiliensis TaxID=1293048 RepID=UPI000677A69D|nr:HalOD1 output domain-containing protein [Halopiger goleimassiliensis]
MNVAVLEHDGSPIHENFFDPAAPAQPSRTIVRALEAVSGRPSVEFAPLYESIDVEALDRFFAHANAKDEGLAPVAVEIPVAEWLIVVSGEGCVRVYECDCETAAGSVTRELE